MYYKVIKDGEVIDILNRLVFLKYQKKHDRMLLSNEEEAQAILSSDGEHAWHLKSLHPITVDGYDTVEVEPISAYEYERLKRLNLMTYQEIIDEYTLSLIEGGVL